MLVVSSENLLAAFENAAYGAYGKWPKAPSECLMKNKFMSVHTFKVGARSWKRVSARSWFADATVSAITEEVHQSGKVIVFLEVSRKHAALPFIYHQMEKRITIRATCERDKVYVGIEGQFVRNVHAAFCFKVVVVGPKVPLKYRELAWHNYDVVKKAFKLPD